MSSPSDSPSSLRHSLVDTIYARRENPWIISSYFSTVLSPSSDCLARYLFPLGVFLTNRSNARVVRDFVTRFFFCGSKSGLDCGDESNGANPDCDDSDDSDNPEYSDSELD